MVNKSILEIRKKKGKLSISNVSRRCSLTSPLGKTWNSKERIRAL
jgi:hypothetical protein